jgi:predicted component of type VI protein secretion system
VLGGRVDDALWDLPKRWWRPAPPVRSLVSGDREWPVGDRGRWVLGRASDADVHLEGDDAVSRRHAELAVRAGLCQIRDLDSCNGTLLNGRRVQRARLHRGDVLVLGETVVRVR